MKTLKTAEFVLDCSVTMALCFEDEVTEYSEKILNTLAHTTAIVPSIWPLEVANVLLMAERKKRISSLKATAFKEALSAFSIHIDMETCNRTLGSTLELAKETGLTIYDAAYLELAMHTDLPIATLDNDLKKAAHMLKIKLLHSP